MLTGDGSRLSSTYDHAFGIFNFVKYDHNHEPVYEHVFNDKFPLKAILTKSTLGNEIMGWFVSHLNQSLNLL